jgi:hypothetical protein
MTVPSLQTAVAPGFSPKGFGRQGIELDVRPNEICETPLPPELQFIGGGSDIGGGVPFWVRVAVGVGDGNGVMAHGHEPSP